MKVTVKRILFVSGILVACALIANLCLFYFFDDFSIEKAQISHAEHDLEALNFAIEIFHSDTNLYPTTSEGLIALVKRPSTWTSSKWKQTMDTIPLDPWKSPYYYIQENKEYTIGSLGPDKLVSKDDLIITTHTRAEQGAAANP